MIRKNDEFVLEITELNCTLSCQMMIDMNDNAKGKWHRDNVTYPNV